MAPSSDEPIRCIFGTCGQIATHRVERRGAYLPLCYEHNQMMQKSGVATEPMPPPRPQTPKPLAA